MNQESAHACLAGTVLTATTHALMALGVRHVTKLVTVLTMVRVVPRMANASARVDGLGPRVIYLAQLVRMAMDVNTGKPLIL